MTVRVDEISSQVEVAGGSGGSAGASAEGGGRSPVPGWTERERHRMLAEAAARDRARVAGEGFDG